MILVVDMNWKRDSLAFNEFVSPIVSVVQPLEECEVKHFLDIETHRAGRLQQDHSFRNNAQRPCNPKAS